MVEILFLVVSYLVGATPTSYWIGRWFHDLDLREHGSGNLGATNTFRVMGWQSAAPVMIVDVLKGWVPVAVFPGLIGASLPWALAYGAAAIVGHVASFWVGFRGGKGVATSAGVFIALAPVPVLGGFLVWLLVTATTRYVSLGSILAAASLPVLVWLYPPGGGRAVLWFTVALAAFVIWAHRSNIRRLASGTEAKVGRSSPRVAERRPGKGGT